jgi:hypothetical protein
MFRLRRVREGAEAPEAILPRASRRPVPRRPDLTNVRSPQNSRQETPVPSANCRVSDSASVTGGKHAKCSQT